MSTRIPTHLTDSQLIDELKRCARGERDATALLIAHLAEMDARQLHLGLGFPSLFAYCLQVLRLSESATCKRIDVARAARQYPVILDRLSEGSLSLTTARLVAPHLTGENHQELLVAASGLRTRAVEELVARRFPRPDIAALVRKLPAREAARCLGRNRRLLDRRARRRRRERPQHRRTRRLRQPLRTRLAGSTLRPIRRLLCHATRVPSVASSGGHAPLGRSVPGPVHGQRVDVEEAAHGTRPAAACGAQRRSRGDLRPGPHGADRRPREEEVRKGQGSREAPSRDGGWVAPRAREGAARGMGARRGSLRLRRGLGAAVPGARLPGVPPRRALRGRRPGDGGEHPASLPRAQRVRGTAVLRPDEGEPLRRCRHAASSVVRLEPVGLNRPRGRYPGGGTRDREPRWRGLTSLRLTRSRL